MRHPREEVVSTPVGHATVPFLALLVVQRRGEAAGVLWHDGGRPLPLLAGLADGLAPENSAT
jgi:hypothetical protein